MPCSSAFWEGLAPAEGEVASFLAGGGRIGDVAFRLGGGIAEVENVWRGVRSR